MFFHPPHPKAFPTQVDYTDTKGNLHDSSTLVIAPAGREKRRLLAAFPNSTFPSCLSFPWAILMKKTSYTPSYITYMCLGKCRRRKPKPSSPGQTSRYLHEKLNKKTFLKETKWFLLCLSDLSMRIPLNTLYRFFSSNFSLGKPGSLKIVLKGRLLHK